MRKYISIFILVFWGIHVWAQPKGYQLMTNVGSFQKTLAKENAEKQTISSDFTQTKNLSLLSDKIKSKGKFYFKKDNKVRIEYTSPYYYLVIMNGGQLSVKDEQKTSKINTRNSKLMQSVNRIMIDCMRGTVFQNPDFKVLAYENGQSYLLSLTPVTPAMKNMFKEIDVYMDKKSMDVHRLNMEEQGGDYTEMDFTNTHHNVSLNEKLFKI